MMTPQELARSVRAKVESAMPEIRELFRLGYSIEVRVDTTSHLHLATGRQITVAAGVKVDITKEERL